MQLWWLISNHLNQPEIPLWNTTKTWTSVYATYLHLLILSRWSVAKDTAMVMQATCARLIGTVLIWMLLIGALNAIKQFTYETRPAYSGSNLMCQVTTWAMLPCTIHTTLEILECQDTDYMITTPPLSGITIIRLAMILLLGNVITTARIWTLLVLSRNKVRSCVSEVRITSSILR